MLVILTHMPVVLPSMFTGGFPTASSGVSLVEDLLQTWRTLVSTCLAGQNAGEVTPSRKVPAPRLMEVGCFSELGLP